MSAKQKRPPVFSLDNLIVSAPKAAEPATEAKVEAKPADAPAAKGEAAMFRTSVYFSRAVHDKLRAIAFEERKTISDLINEGLDHVLTSRHYPTTKEIKGSIKA